MLLKCYYLIWLILCSSSLWGFIFSKNLRFKARIHGLNDSCLGCFQLRWIQLALEEGQMLGLGLVKSFKIISRWEHDSVWHHYMDFNFSHFFPFYPILYSYLHSVNFWFNVLKYLHLFVRVPRLNSILLILDSK